MSGAKKNNITSQTVCFVTQTPYTWAFLLSFCQISGYSVCIAGKSVGRLFSIECIHSLRFVCKKISGNKTVYCMCIQSVSRKENKAQR